MRIRNLIIPALLLLLGFSILSAQGKETFENHALTGRSYVNGSFVGDNGITWNYIQVAPEQDYAIENKGLILPSLGDNARVYSEPISGGIGDFSVQMRKAFTAAGERQIALYVNNTHVADSQTFGGTQGAQTDIHVFSVKDVNVPGDVVIEIRNIQGDSKSRRQFTIDNLEWTGYSGGAVDYPPIANAGKDQFAIFGDTVTLDGSASTDRNNDIKSYLWTQIQGASVTLDDANSAVTHFIAPSENSVLAFELLVTDSTGLSDKDTVKVTVRDNILNTVFISEYIEGSSNNRALEIFNGSGQKINLNDFRIAQANNGGGWQHYHEFPKGATLENGDVWVILNGSCDEDLFSPSDADEVLEYPSVVHFTGNDALALEWTPDAGDNWIQIDVFGDPLSNIEFDVAGIEKAAMDHTLIRKPEIRRGNTDWASSAGTNEDDSEWIVMDMNYFDDLGSHSAGPQAYSFRDIEVVTAFPQSGSEIEIKATVIPGEGSPAPSSVNLYYGSGGSQPNSVEMFQESGNVYATAIPSFSDGNIRIDYYIRASHAGGSSKSATRNFLLAGPLTAIADIHQNISSFNGKLKTIEGVVTIGAGLLRDDRTSGYLQDNSGRGLNIYSETLYSDLLRGTKVKMVGEVELYSEVELYRTTVELKDFNYRILSTNESLPDPMVVSVAGANSDALEGTLAKVTGTLSKVQDFSTSKNLVLKDGNDSTIVKVWPTTGIDVSNLETGILHAITGVGSKFNEEYQLLLAYNEDIDATVSVSESNLPLHFALHAPYPNPFNPATTVEYSLDRAADYSLSVYDLSGRRLAILYSGFAEPGHYRLSWNAAAFTSGIYFIRLEAKSDNAAARLATQKVVLIK